MENRLELLRKRKKDWKGMRVDDWFEWVERGFFKKLKIWSGYG